MMNSNILSRILPPGGSPSIYEAIRQDDASGHSDVEERAAMALDEENLQDSLHDYDPNDAVDSQITTQSTAFLGQGRPQKLSDNHSMKAGGNGARPGRARWLQHLSPRVAEADEGDDDVPASLLIEGHDVEDMPTPPAPPSSYGMNNRREPYPDVGPSLSRRGHRSGSRRDRRRLQGFLPSSPTAQRPGGLSGLASASPKDKAMWRWANVENLDNFLKDVYIYYLGNGIWSILMSRALNLLYGS